MANSHLSPTRRNETSYLALVIIPLVIVFGLLIYGLSQQWSANRYVQAELATLHADGQPRDAASLLAQREEIESRTGCFSWRDLDEAISFLEYKYDGAFELLDDANSLVPASQPWPAEKLAEDYHQEVAPLLKRLQELLATEKKQQGPMRAFTAASVYGTPRWNGDELLLREFKFAYHNGDSARAADLLELYVDVRKVLMGLENSAPPEDIIHRSLEHNFWKANDLGRVRKLLSFHPDVEKQWRQRLDSQLAGFLDNVRMVNDEEVANSGRRPDMQPFGFAPTHVASYLRLYAKLAKLPAAGTKQHVLAVREVDDRRDKERAHLTLTSLSAIPFAFGYIFNAFPTEVYYATAFALQQVDHRRTLTAVAIKQFQLQEGRWPSSLSDLSQVGLAAADWKMVDGIDFGYRVDADGKTARLWRYAERYNQTGAGMFDKDFQFPATPLSEGSASESTIEAAETAIR